MHDLISRQAAIEAMNADNLTWNLDSVNDDDMKRAARADAVLSFLSEVKLTLDKLPTVIPEEEA